MDGASRVELDALTTWLTGADAAGSCMEEAGKLQLRGLLPELEMSLVAWVEVLHRGMELRTFGAELCDGALQLRDRVGLPGIDRGEEREALRVTLDECRDDVVRERRAVGRRLGIPREQNPKHLLLGKLDGELVDAALVDLSTKIARDAFTIWTHAAIEPFLQRQMDMQVDGADQAMRPAFLLLRSRCDRRRRSSHRLRRGQPCRG